MNSDDNIVSRLRDEITYWTVICLVIAIICLSVFFSARWIYRFSTAIDRSACTRWGEEIQLETKFIKVQDFGWGWTCFVKTDDGWITKNNLVIVKGLNEGVRDELGR